MEILDVAKMQQMQYQLWEKYKLHWPPLKPNQARNSLLWMIEEIGEVISILKKRGEEDVMTDMELRKDMVEELCDIMMFFTDVLIEFGISPIEFTDSYYNKYNKNMLRDFIQDDRNYLRK
jgi:NTP pyrophosphatase (non-canonical NTP hydrolase)